MFMKARYLTLGILLICLSLAAFHAPLQAQDTPEPAATEDPCIAIIEAGMEPQDNIAPAATEDPAFASCLDAFDAAETNATPAPNTALLDESQTSRSAAGADNAPFHSITVMNRSTEFLGRFWLTWHVPGTGALVALGSGTILAGLSGTLPVPSGAFGIGVRVELYARPNSMMGGNMFNPDWIAADNCHFAFNDAHQDQTIFLDAVSTGLVIPVAPVVDSYGCSLAGAANSSLSIDDLNLDSSDFNSPPDVGADNPDTTTDSSGG